MQYEEIKELIAIFEKTDLNDMEVQLDNAVLRLNRGAVSPWSYTENAKTAQMPVMPQKQTVVNETAEPVVAEEVKPQKENAPQEAGKVIKSPIVGTFYQSAAPDEEPFVQVGDSIQKGDVVCIIEAMKFMNEVNSEVSGTITEILVEDGEFVEYGQELFRVK